MDILIGICSTIVGEIAKVTVEPVGRQLGYLFYYQRNINDLRKQIEDLNVKKTSLDCRVEQARRWGEEIEKIVLKWQGEVEQCSKDAEDILEHEGHREAKCSCSRSFPNLVMRRKLSRKAKKMVEVIASKKADTFESISYPPILEISFKNKDFEEFGTRTLALKKIMEALKDLNFRRIGVHGSGGVGKTTLVKEAARKSREEGLFTEVVMVTVSQSFELQKIQREIADKLSMETRHEESVSALAERLQHRLKDEKNLLIILDDLWERLELEDAGIYFNKDGQEGCKILLVSRNRYVLRNDMGVEKDIMVELLSESEAMNLFKKVVGGKSEERNFKDLVIAIVEKCGGLPVAIKPIARALKDRDISAWRTALMKLKSSPKDGYGEAYSCIKTSYDFLKDDEKMILLLCAHHREDENISVEDLMNIYAASCGLFLEVDTLQDVRDLVRTLVDNLKGYNLLLEGEEDGSVKLHDVTREITVSIAMEDKSMYCYENSRSLNSALVNGKLNHEAIGISLLGRDFNQFPDGLPCSKLRLLLMDHGVHWSLGFRPKLFLKEFFEKAIELRALRIRSIIVQPLQLSPSSLQKLQTLSLQHCVLEEIAFIGELKNLEVLDLSHSEFKRLPQQIGKLTSLRQLNLNQCFYLKEIQPKVISSLVRLEELYMNDVSVEWGVEAVDGERRNASLAEVENLPQLSALHLYIEDAGVLPKDMFVDGKLKRFNIIVGGKERDYELETSSRRLYLKVEESSHLYEPGFPMLMKESEVLYLRTLSGVTRGLPFFQEKVAFPDRHLESSSMWNLTKLNVSSCWNLKHVFVSAFVGSLTQLEDLKITDCPAMEEVIAVEEGANSQVILFRKLTSLKLEDLESLKTFCGGDYKIEFESLLKLMITDCPKLKTFTSNSMPFTSTSSVNGKIEQPLINDKVGSFNIMLSGITFKDLQELTIWKCDNLQYLLPFETVKNLKHLKKLDVRGCVDMEQIITKEEVGRLKNISFPKLESIDLTHLPKLKRFCEGDRVECPSLLKLNIWRCPEFRTFISNSVSVEETELVAQQPLFNDKVVLINLEELAVYVGWEDVNEVLDLTQGCSSDFSLSKCDRFKILVMSSSFCFENLTKLRVSECHGLVNLFDSSIAKTLVQLKTMRITKCNQLIQAITEDVNKMEDELAEREIVFNQLESLSLELLPSLKSFYGGKDKLEFPKLEKLAVERCPKMRTFSHGMSISNPNLKTIYTGYFIEEDFKGDLNASIGKLWEKSRTTH